MSDHKQSIKNSQRYLKPALIVAVVLLLIATYFAVIGRQTTTELSDAEAAVAGARAIYIEGALKSDPKATYAGSNCEFNALNEHYTLVGLLSLQDKIDSSEATETELRELRSTVAHCRPDSKSKL